MKRQGVVDYALFFIFQRIEKLLLWVDNSFCGKKKMDKKYKVEKTFVRYVGKNSRKETKKEMVKMDSRPSLPVLVAMLEFTRWKAEDWLCVEVDGLVKEKPRLAPWKVGVEISFVPDGDVLILYNPTNKIDKTKPIVPDCKFTLLPYQEYKKLREKHATG